MKSPAHLSRGTWWYGDFGVPASCSCLTALAFLRLPADFLLSGGDLGLALEPLTRVQVGRPVQQVSEEVCGTFANSLELKERVERCGPSQVLEAPGLPLLDDSIETRQSTQAVWKSEQVQLSAGHSDPAVEPECDPGLLFFPGLAHIWVAVLSSPCDSDQR